MLHHRIAKIPYQIEDDDLARAPPQLAIRARHKAAEAALDEPASPKVHMITGSGQPRVTAHPA